MMRRKVSLSSEEDRKTGADKIREDENLFNEFFTAMESNGLESQPESNFEALGYIANIVGADEEMLTFELMTLLRQVYLH